MKMLKNFKKLPMSNLKTMHSNIIFLQETFKKLEDGKYNIYKKFYELQFQFN